MKYLFASILAATTAVLGIIDKVDAGHVSSFELSNISGGITNLKVALLYPTHDPQRAGAYTSLTPGGSSGVLTGHNWAEGDQTFKFFDTVGNERCRGRVEINFKSDQGSVKHYETIWHIDGRMPGSHCSTTGQSFTVPMYHFKYQ